LRFERNLEQTVETFYQPIGDGVVGGRADPLGTEELHEVSEEFRLKLASSVYGDGRGGTKANNPT